LYTAPRIVPQGTPPFTRVDGSRLQSWGFRKEKVALKTVPPDHLQIARHVLKQLHMGNLHKPTPNMWLPYYLSHHIFNRVYNERECQHMIKTLANQARQRLAPGTDDWDADRDVVMNEFDHVVPGEEQGQEQAAQFSDDDDDEAIMLAAAQGAFTSYNGDPDEAEMIMDLERLFASELASVHAERPDQDAVATAPSIAHLPGSMQQQLDGWWQPETHTM
jgi:hypothetical protein